MLDESQSKPNSTDNDAELERAGSFNVTIASNRDLNVNVICANV